MVSKPYGTKKFGSLKCNTIPLQWITLLLNLIVAITYNLLACHCLLPAKCRTSNLSSRSCMCTVFIWFCFQFQSRSLKTTKHHLSCWQNSVMQEFKFLFTCRFRMPLNRKLLEQHSWVHAIWETMWTPRAMLGCILLSDMRSGWVGACWKIRLRAWQ